MILDSSSAFDLWNLGDWISEIFNRCLINLAGLVYDVVGIVYEVFQILARANIFKNSDYQALSTRVYVILGVVVLFVLAYNFLLLVIDPDKNKGGASVEKMLKNIVTTFVLIVLCPSIFTFAYDIQGAILTQNNLIEKFFSGATAAEAADHEKNVSEGGKTMAINTFTGFFYAANGTDNESLKKVVNKSYEDNWCWDKKGNEVSEDCYMDCREEGTDPNDSKNPETCTLYNAIQLATSTGSFKYFKAFGGNMKDGLNPENKVEFNFLLSIVAGAYLIYVIVSFCFDLGVRVVKLAFYQIIAPLTIACRVLPNKESIYSTWLKQTISTFVSVFIRVFIMQLGVYLLNIIVKNMKGNTVFAFCGENNSNCSFMAIAFAKVCIILGIVTFIKTASNLICTIFGLESPEGLGKSIKEKIAEGGGFAMGAGLGAAATGLTRNAVSAARRNQWKGKGFWGTAGRSAANIARMAGSGIAGAASGAARGLYHGRNAQSWSQMSGAAGTASEGVTNARDNRLENGVFGSMGLGVASMAGRVGDWATAGDRSAERALQEAAERKKAFDEVEAQAQKIIDKLETNRDFYSAIFEVAQSEKFDLFNKLSDSKEPGELSDRDKAKKYYQEHGNWSMHDYQRRIESLRNGESTAEVDKNKFLTLDEEKAKAEAAKHVDKAQFTTTDMEAYKAAQDAAARKIDASQFGNDTQAYLAAAQQARDSVDISAFQKTDTEAYNKAVEEAMKNIDLSQFQKVDETAYAKAVQDATNEEIRTLTNVTGALQKAAVEQVSSFAHEDYKNTELKDIDGKVVQKEVEIKDVNGNVVGREMQNVTVHDTLNAVVGAMDLTDLKGATDKAVFTTAQTVPGGVIEYDNNGEAKTQVKKDPRTNAPVLDKDGNVVTEYVTHSVDEKTGTFKEAKDVDKYQTLNDKREAQKDAAARARRDARRARRGSDKK